MATQYSFEIETIEVAPQTETHNNVVKNIAYWIIAISDENIKYNFRKVINLEPPLDPNFINIQDITEDIIRGWVENHPDFLTDQDKINIENRLSEERSKDLSNRYNFPFLKSMHNFFN